ncbi:MAG: transposase [Sphingobacteriales bacterium]|nr:transposase [Sphingobacteriales bacterium]MBI3718867.1 transposase [Sphingobacteriales bacterium]
MSRKYKFHDNQQIYFVSFAVVGWIDLFVRNEYKDELVKSLDYCIKHKDLELYAWCIMTSHVHLIIGSRGKPLADIMRDFKRHTSEQLHILIKKNPKESRREWMLEMMEKAGRENSNNTGFQLWQQHNHPIALPTQEITHQKLDYLHNNPVVAGFVEKPEDWLYSSAKDYYTGKKGMLDIILIEPLVVIVK